MRLKGILVIVFTTLAIQSKAQLENYKEILAITITGAEGSSATERDNECAAGYKAFGGYCDTDFFKGEVLPGGFDNMKKENGISTLYLRAWTIRATAVIYSLRITQYKVHHIANQRSLPTVRLCHS